MAVVLRRLHSQLSLRQTHRLSVGPTLFTLYHSVCFPTLVLLTDSKPTTRCWLGTHKRQEFARLLCDLSLCIFNLVPGYTSCLGLPVNSCFSTCASASGRWISNSLFHYTSNFRLSFPYCFPYLCKMHFLE